MNIVLTSALSVGFLAFNLVGLYFLKNGANASNDGLGVFSQSGLFYALGAVLQIVAFVIFGYLLKLMPVFLVQVLQALVFPFSLLLAWFVFHENINMLSFVGICFIILGMGIVIFAQS